MNIAPQDLKSQIKARAASLGFILCGITNNEPTAEYHRYTEWLMKGYHAGMAYLETEYHRSSRQDPNRLFPNLKSIIVLGMPYRLTTRSEMVQRAAGVISGYAIGEDYHQRFPRLLEPLIEFLKEISPDTAAPRVFTDSTPILERELAARAGLGWIGKNSCLISPVIGSAFLLAEIFTSIPIESDTPELRDLCGTCERCLDACPTGCILPDRTIDANRCISYHSIENRGEIPSEIISRFTNQLFGCDICQAVCPWNRVSTRVDDQRVNQTLYPILELQNLVNLTQDAFNKRFGDTPVARAKMAGLQRNARIVVENMFPKIGETVGTK